MKLGIVIGVSEYPPEVGNLPACGTDAAAITAILNTESEFEDVLTISDNTTSSRVKRLITEFVAKNKGREIEQVFFYFSGHGDFANEEFFYLLSDYDPKRRRQTCLENNEVDNLLRALSPKTAVKFIDACHSGATYIKDSGAFDNYIKASGTEFGNCYFLFSSLAEQYSYQDAGLSFFTRAIVDSVLDHDETDLRYKAVMDYVSDAFSSNAKQTPFFVVQADFTETFCTVSAALKASLNNALTGLAPVTEPEPPPTDSLADRVRKDAEAYCSESETYDALAHLKTTLDASPHPSDLEGLYCISVEEGNELTGLPNATAIGNWLDQNQHDFFAVPRYESVTVTRRTRKSRMQISLMFDDDAFYDAQVEEDQIRGFKNTVDVPYVYLHLNAEPLLPNIAAFDCFVVPVVSRIEIRLFYAICRYRDVDWNRRERHSSHKWVTGSHRTKDRNSIDNAVAEVANYLWQEIRDQLHEKFGPPEGSTTDSSDHPDPDGEPAA